MKDNQETLRRWRLMLGKYSSTNLSDAGYSAKDWQLEGSLEYLYGREYSGRGILSGTLDESQINAVDWLNKTRNLFPAAVFEKIQQQALEKYQITDLLKNPAVVAQMNPSVAMAKTLLSMRGRVSQELLTEIRVLIRRCVDEIIARLRPEVTAAFIGRRNRFRQSTLKSINNFDWKTTIKRNLKHFDYERNQILLRELVFNSRSKRHLPWDVILCVDQSGSMVESIMYSAIVAGILSSLPGVSIRLVLFDTSVVDMTHHIADPVEVLLTVQLGGGTDIGKAIAYCESTISNPRRTVLALVSDFCEGANPNHLITAVRRLHESGVTLLGLTALTEDSTSWYDMAMAQRLANVGMKVASLTPGHFAEWLSEIMA